jgi:hypothetical protein
LWDVCANHVETISAAVGGGIGYGETSLRYGRKKNFDYRMYRIPIFVVVQPAVCVL